MCSDNDWDPAVLDKKISDDNEWYDAIKNFSEIPDQSNFDERGNFCKRTIPDETFKLTPEIRVSSLETSPRCIVDINFVKQGQEVIPDELDGPFLFPNAVNGDHTPLISRDYYGEEAIPTDEDDLPNLILRPFEGPNDGEPPPLMDPGDDSDDDVKAQVRGNTHEVIKKWTYADDVLYVCTSNDGYEHFYDPECDPDFNFYDTEEVTVLEVHPTETDEP